MEKKSKKPVPRKLMLAILCIIVALSSSYLFIPGLREHSQQTVDSAKAVAGHYLPMSPLDAFATRQVITKDSGNSRTIMWQSELAEPTAVVEYRVKNSAEITAISAENQKFTDDGKSSYLHTVQLEKLTSGTEYEYRIGAGDKRSDWYPLQTATGEAFKVLIFPDSQSSDYSDWRNLAQTAWKNNPDARFFVNMGDLVDNGEDHSQWRAWFDAVSGMREAIPVAPVLGNHETYNREWKVRMPEAYLKLFALPDNGVAERQNQFYSFDYGDVHFVVLNTQVDEMEAFQPGLLAAQQAWFAQDLANTTKKWKVVLMHKDVLTYEIKNRANRKAGISDIGTAWMPLFDQYGIDAVLTAHLHTYRRRGNLYNFVPDSRGPLYILTGVAGNVRYPGLWVDHPFDQSIAPQPETDNYLTMEASADTLRFAVFLADGRQIDQAEIKK